MARFLVALCLCIPLLFFSSPAFSEEQLSVSNPSIVVVGDMNLNLTKREQNVFKAKTLSLIAATRRDDHPIAYSCLLDIENPSHIAFVETWTSRAALDDHLERDAFKSWFSWVKPRIDGSLTINIAPESAFSPF